MTTPLTPEEEAERHAAATPFEEQRTQAMVHYERIANEQGEWSSFVRDAIRERRERVDPDLRAALTAFFEDVDADWSNDNLRPGSFAFRFRAAADRLREAVDRGPCAGCGNETHYERDHGDDGCEAICAAPTNPGARCTCQTYEPFAATEAPRDPNMDYERRDAILDVVRRAYPATPDHTVVGEEREAEIDVERLARAAANESDSATEDERRNGDLWSLLSERIRDDWRRKAHRIAAEYRATPRPR